MASSMDQLLSSLSLLLLILAGSCSQTLARESKFFSKAIHIHSTAKNVEEMKPPHTEIPVGPLTPSQKSQVARSEFVLVDSPTPAPAPAPATTAPVTAPVSSETESGYGLYGHGSGILPPEKETKTTPTTTPAGFGSQATLSSANDNDNFENEVLAEELNGESLEEEYSNNNYHYDTNANKKKENVYSDNYYLYGGSKNNVGYSASYKTTDSSNDGRYYPGNYNANGRQGMSDTRFVENGKYYYDVNKGDNDRSTFEPEDEKESYMTTGEANRYDPNYSKYVFNSMEEYYQSQGYHQNNPEEYIP